MMLRNRKGQSTMEYVILVAAVIAVIIGFLGTENSTFRSTLNGTLEEVTFEMDTMTNRLKNARPQG